jgi:PAS domain S-box-containing protein
MLSGAANNKLLAVALALITIVLLAVGAGLHLTLVQWQSQQHAQRYNNLGHVVALGVAHQLSQPDSPQLKLKQYLLQVLHTTPDIQQVVVSDQRNRPVLQLQSKTAAAEGAREVSSLESFAISIPTPQNVKALNGTLTLQVNAVNAGLHGGMLTMLLVSLWTGLAAIWAVVVTTLAMYANWLNKPIRQVMGVINQLSTGDFGITMEEGALTGDIKAMVRAFNDMSMRLRLYQDNNVESLTLERNRLQRILLSIADGVIVCNSDGTAKLLNDSAVRMLGLKHYTTLVGGPLTDYMTVDGNRPFDACLASYHNNEDESAIMTQTVKLLNTTLRVIISPIMDTTGQPLGLVLIMHDITSDVAIDQMKTSFIANVSHELRTPVTTIKTYVDTLCQHGKDLDAETYQEFMDTLNLETDRLKRLVNDVLDVARLQEGVQLAVTPEELGPIIHLTVQSMTVLAKQKHITISTNIETDLPTVMMNADSIERVVRNLLSNAIKYTPTGGRIRCRAELIAGGRQIEVTVEDNGMGIAAEHLPHIFDRFYRVENATHTVKGTGLGLHLVKMTIEDYHQGEVFVKSQPGEGSIFGFRLPVVSLMPEPNEDEPLTDDTDAYPVGELRAFS